MPGYFSAAYQPVCCTSCLGNVQEPERAHLYGLLQNALPSGQELQLQTQREVSRLVNETFHILLGLRRGGSDDHCWQEELEVQTLIFISRPSARTPNHIVYIHLCSMKALELSLTFLLADIFPSFPELG